MRVILLKYHAMMQAVGRSKKLRMRSRLIVPYLWRQSVLLVMNNILGVVSRDFLGSRFAEQRGTPRR